MKTSDATIKQIEAFEGCVLHAYKPVAAEQYYTIGYGHYGADVSADMVITQGQADVLFRQDLTRFEAYVTATALILTQPQFDALVSFTYNCGPGNLSRLIKNRTHAQIAEALLLYVKDASGNTLPGLVRRRQWEHDLFLSGMSEKGNPYPEPTRNLAAGSRGDDVRWLQYALNGKGYSLAMDGIFGVLTRNAVINFQQKQGIGVDGIVGAVTRGRLKL